MSVSGTGSLFPEQRLTIVPRDGGGGGALRPYQVTAVARIEEALQDNRSTLLTMATGTGKTRVFGEVAHRHEGRVLVLAHRLELVSQARRRIGEITGEMVGTERAGWHSQGERIVCASKDSLHEGRRRAFDADDFSLIIIDEAHHACAPTYTRIIEHFPNAKILGVTATPDRADEKALGMVFHSVAFVYEMMDGIEEGYLCPIIGETANVASLDLSSVKAGGVDGDLGDGQLGGIVGRDDVMHSICAETIRLADARPTIMFFPTVETAYVAAETLDQLLGKRVAKAIDGTTDDDERGKILRAHEAGKFQFLVNCGVLTEGYDSPKIACVAIARPTKSRSLYAQMIGRGTRIALGKQNCLVLDFVGNAGKHALIGPIDVLAGRYDDEVRELAAKKQREEGGDAQMHIKMAQAELDEQRRLAARRVVAQPKAQTAWQKFDPFVALGVSDPGSDPWAAHYETPASDAQVAALRNAGVLGKADTCSKQQAHKLLSALKARREKGLATVKQLHRLSQFGKPKPDMTFAVASALLTAIEANGWHRPSADVLKAIFASQGRPS